jgi:predicted double-glycine peptidase
MGTNALQAVNALRQLGFARSAKHTLAQDELQQLVAAGHFPIVFVSLLPLDQRDDIHALVVTDIREATVTVLDPLKGERVIPSELFYLAWQSRHNLAILVER